MTNGSELKPSQVMNEPRVGIGGRDMRTLYTLVRSTIFLSYLVMLAMMFLCSLVSLFFAYLEFVVDPFIFPGLGYICILLVDPAQHIS
jgi:hypothetical protein